MFVRELFEAISLAKFQPIIQKELYNIITKNQDVLQYIKQKVMEITGVGIEVKVESMPKGDGSYVKETNTLTINSKVLKTIQVNLQKFLTAQSGKETLKHELNDSISRLTHIIVHESTHVIQLAKSGQPYEKSMVHNKSAVDNVMSKLGLKSKKQRANYQGDKEDLNLKKLNVYLARLGDPKSEINMVVDRAQPEEITAYANQSAAEIISTIDADDPRTIRSAIRHALKQLKNSKNNLTQSVKDYKIVNKYSVKAHNRFFKLLYLKLIDYYDSIH